MLCQLPNSKYLRHVTLEEPLEVVIDGLSQRAVVMKPGKSFGVHAQVDAFMSMDDYQ